MNKPSRSTNIPNNDKAKNNINWALWDTLSGIAIYNKTKDWYYQDTSWRFILWVDWWVNWINAKINLWNIARIYKRMQHEFDLDDKWSKTPDEEDFFNALIEKNSKFKLENLLWYFVLINTKSLENNKEEVINPSYLAFVYISTLIKVITRINKEWLDLNQYIYNKNKFTKYLQESISLLQSSRQKEMKDKVNELIWVSLNIDNKEGKKSLKIKTSTSKLKLAGWVALIWWLTFLAVDWISKFNWPKSHIESKIQNHIVATKETAYGIAKKYWTTTETLTELNKDNIKNIAEIKPWQIIRIK